MSTIEILIAYAEPRQQREVAVEVPRGITLQEAVVLLATQIGVLLNGEPMGTIGVWGKIRPPHYVLRDGDRIECYRPLKADPKQARRARVTQQIKRDS